MNSAAPAPPRPEDDPREADRLRGGSTMAWVVSLLLAAVLGALLFVGGWLVGGAGGGMASCAAPSEPFVSFCQAYDKLKSEFVDELDDEQLVEGAIQGMFQHGVRDPYSSYMPPEDYQRALGDLSGRFEGIGAEMALKNLEEPGNLEPCTTLSDICVMVVVAPLPDSPAERAGLEPGDIVLAVDGQSVHDTTMADQIARVRGPAGTDVTLTLRRDETEFDVTITRAEIQMREVRTRMIDDRIGYISLRGFSDASVEQFGDGLSELIEDGAQQVIFDLRNNGGGYIIAARSIASQFVDSGVIFTQESSGGRVEEWRAESGGAATDPAIDVVVLTNVGTASASEIVVAALQELGRATIIGEPTFGKNTVQVWAPLQNQGGIRITISRWFTPSHESVEPDGIQPDIAVEIPAETQPDEDPILDRAVAELTARGADARTGEPDIVAVRRAAVSIGPDSPISYDPRGLTVAEG
jgi:carboxyl-terminal processing protease